MSCEWTPENIKNLSDEDLALVMRESYAVPPSLSLVKRGMSAVAKAYTDLVNDQGAAVMLDSALGTDRSKMTFEDTFQNTRASRTRANYIINGGTIVDPRNVTKGSDANLMEAFRLAKAAGGTKDGMVDYQVALQSLQDHARGMKTAMSPVVAAATVERGHKHYAKAVNYFNRNVLDDLLKYEIAGGMTTRERADAMIRDNPYYIKLSRDMGMAEEVKNGIGSGASGMKVKGLARKTGSERKIEDPIRATLEAVYHRVMMTDRNVALHSLIGQDPRILATLGISRVADPKVTGPRTKNDFVVFRNGDPEVWTVQPDKVELVRLINGTTPLENGVFAKLHNAFAAVKRSGITNMPDFLLKAFVRDGVSAAVLNEHGGVPFQRAVAGMLATVFNKAALDEYARAGGFGVALNEMDVDYLKRNVDKVFEETGVWSRVVNAVPSIWHAWQTVAMRVDSFGRLGQYMALRKKGMEPVKAAMGARRYSLDFAQHGASALLKYWSQKVPFLNPAILGTEQIARAFAPDRFFATTAKAMMYITVPSMAIYALNMIADEHLPDDEKYARVPRWQRDLFWVLPPIEGVRIRIPKPFVIGQVFGSLPERIMDHTRTHDPRAFKELSDSIIAGFVLPLMPALEEPVIENAFNLDTFNKRPLIPAGLEDASNYMQYTPNTSDTAIELARLVGPQGANLVNVSPIVLENYVNGWAGSAGDAVLAVVDGAFKPANDVSELSDNPFIKSLVVREHDMGTPVITDFYDRVQEITAKRRDLKLAIERRDPRLIDFTKADPQAMIRVSKMQTVMSKHQSAIRAIRYNPDMTVDEKRQMIEAKYKAMLVLAERGLALMDKRSEAGE